VQERAEIVDFAISNPLDSEVAETTEISKKAYGRNES
jgi:hypothetical protein